MTHETTQDPSVPTSPTPAEETREPEPEKPRRQRQRMRLTPPPARRPAPIKTPAPLPSTPSLAAGVPGLPGPLAVLLDGAAAALQQMVYETANKATRDALAAHAAETDRLFDNAAAAAYIYGDHPRAIQRWRCLKNYQKWIDDLSNGASGRLRRWTRKAMEEIVSRLGREA